MSVRRTAGAALVAVVITVLVGCAIGGSMTDGTSPSASTRPPFHTAPRTATATGTPVAVPATRWDALRADLVGRGVGGDPVLVTSEAVTWPNGALGCPAPGMSYTQQIVEGMRVVVEADGRRWDYRFGGGDTPLLCEGLTSSP